MQTTCDLEDDIFEAVESLARQKGIPIGKVLSDLARQALAHQPTQDVAPPYQKRNGVPLFPIQPNARPVTSELIQSLLDEEP